jgi:hypothetical protein
MRKIPLAIIGLALTAACAQSPDAIAPVAMGDAYQNVSCSKARTLLSQEKGTLAALSTQQTNAAKGDTIGVLLIGVPVSSVTGGNKAGDIAATKGKVEALTARLLSCG